MCGDCWRGSRNSGFIEETPKSKEILRVRIKNFRPHEYKGNKNDPDLPDYNIIGGNEKATDIEQECLEAENNATPQDTNKKGDSLEKNELEMAKMATGLSGKRRKAEGRDVGDKDDYDTDGTGDINVTEGQKKARKKLFDTLEKGLN